MDETPDRTAGRLARIRRYPVKGLGGEDLSEVEMTPAGVPFDRIVALAHGLTPLRPHGEWTTYGAFHALTSSATLGLSEARVVAKVGSRSSGASGARPLTDPDGGGVLEIWRSGRKVAAIPVVDGAPQIGEELVADTELISPDRPVSLTELGVNLWDVESAHVSLINLATVRALSHAAGTEIDPLRFRANIYYDAAEAWSELSWVGKRISVGEVELEVFAGIERCRATSAQPGGAAWDLNVPGLLASRFGHAFCGVYARVVRPGVARVDDAVRVLSGDHAVIDGPDSDLVTPSTPRVAEVVSAVRAESDAVSLSFRDPFNLLEAALPGQYLRVHRVDGAAASWRNYTISSVDAGLARITVQRVPEGRFTPWLTDVRNEAQVVISGPHGDVVLADGPTPVLIMTAGIGITPALRILEYLARSGSTRLVEVVHVARNADNVPHWAEVEAWAKRLDCAVTLYLTGSHEVPVHQAEAREKAMAPQSAAGASPSHRQVTRAGRPTPNQLVAHLTSRSARGQGSGHPGGPLSAQNPVGELDVDLFLCGPSGFVEQVASIARSHGMEADRIHRDPFYSPPDTELERKPAPAPGPFVVAWQGSAPLVWTEDSGTLLDLAEAAGLQPPAACRSGVCGTCTARVRGATAPVIDAVAAPAAGRVLLCTVVPTEDVSVES